MSKNAKCFSLLALITIFIFACTLPSGEATKNDPNIIFTAAVETASVQLTEISAQNPELKTPSPPSSIILPSATPLAGIATIEESCDKAKFITDVTVSDGTVIAPGEKFTKTWRVQNIGTCTWTTGYALVYDGGIQMSGRSPQALLGDVGPNETVDISIDFVAPQTNGNYTSNWQIKNASNGLFAKIYVQIKVGIEDFAVTSVREMDSYYVSGRGAAFVAKITANKAGKVTYYWIIRETGQPDIKTSLEEIVFTSGGTQEISTLWGSCPHAGSFTASLYIDKPNHQEFGTSSFNCP